MLPPLPGNGWGYCIMNPCLVMALLMIGQVDTKGKTGIAGREGAESREHGDKGRSKPETEGKVKELDNPQQWSFLLGRNTQFCKSLSSCVT